MILYGRDLSPFVRRVAIWCDLQERPVERRKIMVSGPDWATLRDVTPVGRVPALVLDDGAVLVETHAIIDWLEETAPPGARLIPTSGTARRDVMQRIARATSLAEKTVALVYEKVRRPQEFHWADWIARIEGQVGAGLAELEAQAPEEGWHSGTDRLDGADIATVVAWDMVEIMHPYLVETQYPRLKAMSRRAAEIPAFAKTRPAA